jgi:CHAD domain-containing protein
MDSRRHDEVERKYDIAAEVSLATLTGVEGVASMGQQQTFDLESVYFDTAELDLHRRGMSLRRRTGGRDDGWHLKGPRQGDRRTELQLPLGSAGHTVPADLLQPVRAVVRDRPLSPVATVTTHRLEQSVIDDAGAVIATLCDDQVRAQNLREPAEHLTWREVELELGEGQPPDLLDLLEVPLLDSGARPSSAGSKLGRALGDVPTKQAGGKDRRVRHHRKARRATAAEALLAHLEDQVAALQRHDRGVREGAEGSVHRLRIAARRLRSALRTYQAVMAPGTTDRLCDELKWLGQTLAPARDAEVMRHRLAGLVAAQPPELVLGDVPSRIDQDLAARQRSGLEAAQAALDTERYYRLLDALDDLLEAPAWSQVAGSRARKVLPTLVSRQARSLRRAARRAQATDGEDRDVALHTARKKAKRLRYAAESARPFLGAGAGTLAKRAKRAQSALGDHQDSVVARAVLREQGIRAHLEGANAFTFGRLHGLEQQRARAAEEAFASAMSGLRAKDVARLLRS